MESSGQNYYMLRDDHDTISFLTYPNDKADGLLDGKKSPSPMGRRHTCGVVNASPASIDSRS